MIKSRNRIVRVREVLLLSVFAPLAWHGAAVAQTYQENITSDTTLSNPATPPAGYSQVGYSLQNGATLTLSPSLNTSSTIYLTAANSGGTLINNGAINTSGAAIASFAMDFSGGLPAVVNNGSVTSHVVNSYAISTGSYGLGSVTNNGSIVSVGGGGVNMFANYPFSNAGSVTADQTAVYAFDSVVTNSGTIHSNNGLGFYGYGNVGTPASNSGQIYGQTIGAQLLGYTLTNTGTIASPGLAVSVDPYGTLINSTGGVINGNIGAALYGFTFNARVQNTGTINGNVDFGTFAVASNNVYAAMPGGVLNGNLYLGAGGDTFITSLANSGPGQFAGVTGTVTGRGVDTLRYLVTADGTSRLNQSSLFGTVLFDVTNSAKLTINELNGTSTPIQILGIGSADITANITATGATALNLNNNASLYLQQQPFGAAPNRLNVVNHGALTTIFPSTMAKVFAPTVWVGGLDSFTNAGTVVAKDLNPNYAYFHMPAIAGEGTVINDGVIQVQSADGIQGTESFGVGGSLTVTNTGSIEEIAGAATSRGIVNATTVTNSGSISVGGQAVILGGNSLFQGTTLTNSGSIISSGDAAVVGNAEPTTITNQTGGSISGQTYGVQVNGNPISTASVINAGLISGGSGSVVFSGGQANTLILQTGSTLIGDAVGSTLPNAVNNLVLQGAGVANNNFLKFTNLNAQGSGVWSLNGISSISATTVASGVLQIGDAAHPGAKLTSNVTVNAGGVLSGHGVVAGQVTNNGIVSPGGSVGVLTIQGDYVQNASGVLSLEASTSQQSKLIVTGHATLAGGLNIKFDPGIYRNGLTFDVLDVAGGTTGAFSGVTASNGMGLNLTTQGGSAVVTVTQGLTPLAYGANPNQLAIAHGFSDYGPGNSTFDPLANALIAMPQGAAQNAAFGQLGGEVYADLLTAGRVRAQADTRNLMNHLGRADGAEGAPVVWGQATGGFGAVDATANASGYAGHGAAFAAGIERGLGGGATLGLSASYDRSDLSLKSLPQSGVLSTGAVWIYGEKQWSQAFVGVVAGYGFERGDADRTMSEGGVLLQSHGNFNGSAPGAALEAGLKDRIGDILIEPSIAILYDRVRQNDLIETNGGGADLAITARDVNAVESLAGLRVTRAFAMGGGRLRADVRAAWAHEYGETPVPLAGESFAAAPGSNFVLSGVRQNTDHALLGVGLSFASGARSSFSLHYDGDVGSRAVTQTVSSCGPLSVVSLIAGRRGRQRDCAWW